MKTAIVTGGSRGLGKDASLKLARMGVDVIFTYKSNVEEAKKVETEIRKLGRKAHALQLDAGDIKSFPQFADQVRSVLKSEFGAEKFDYLLNNAGMAGNAPIPEFTEEQFDALTNTHFKGVFFLTQKLLPVMNDGGRILNVSSGLARFSFPGYSVYGALKGAIDVMTRYMALELGPRKISVNSIAPGAIATDFGGGRVRDNQDFNQMLASQTALGRVGLPEDIGDIMAELLAGKTTWINGQRIEASGGFHL
jgi:NAD(P)-dependent dehydrogenase (short-subunit alcohol dehydrogenase family)